MELMQLITYGNEFIRKTAFVDNISLDTFVDDRYTIDFIEETNIKGEKIIAKNPIDWFHYLSQKKCLNLKLFHVPEEAHDYLNVCYDYNADGWYIEAVFNDHIQLWKGVLTHDMGSGGYVKSRKKTYTRVNRVTSTLLKKNTSLRKLTLSATTETLYQSLIFIKNFASEKINENGWARRFQNIIDILDYNQTETTTFIIKDFLEKNLIIQTNYTNNSLILLKASCNLFIFTGRNSWNDLSFYWSSEYEKYLDEYKVLTKKLYLARNNAIITSFNSSNYNIQNNNILL